VSLTPSSLSGYVVSREVQVFQRFVKCLTKVHPGNALEHPQTSYRVLRLPPYLQTRRFQPGSISTSLVRLATRSKDAETGSVATDLQHPVFLGQLYSHRSCFGGICHVRAVLSNPQPRTRTQRADLVLSYSITSPLLLISIIFLFGGFTVINRFGAPPLFLNFFFWFLR
jgi:hypothetical protein